MPLFKDHACKYVQFIQDKYPGDNCHTYKYSDNNYPRTSTSLTHSRRDLFKVFDIGFGQIEGILGIILAKEFFKKSN